MKILRVITSMNPKSGGPCQGIRNINPYIKQLGIEVEVICMDATTDEYVTNDDFVIHKLGQGKTGYQYQPLLYPWLLKNALEFDCIIVHGLWQHYNVAVYKAVKKLKNEYKKVPKVIIMPHGMMDPYFQTASDRKLKALRNELVWHFIEKKCINEADAIFYTCEEELRLATTTFKGYRPKKTINVSYGIQAPPESNLEFDNAFFKKCPKVLGKEYWLFLSRIHEKKGVDLLIKAYSELAAKIPFLPELVIAGPIESSYAQEMIKMASGNLKIHFPGMLQGKEKWGAFYNCQAYLLPSHQENFGIAIVEAMACSKPVVISKNVNIWKEIEAGNGGWILNKLNEREIYNTLLAISHISNAEIIQKGKEAYGAFRTNFNVKERATIFKESLQKL